MYFLLFILYIDTNILFNVLPYVYIRLCKITSNSKLLLTQPPPLEKISYVYYCTVSTVWIWNNQWTDVVCIHYITIFLTCNYDVQSVLTNFNPDPIQSNYKFNYDVCVFPIYIPNVEPTVCFEYKPAWHISPKHIYL